MLSHKVPIHAPLGSQPSFIPLSCSHACLRLTDRMRMLSHVTPSFLTGDKIEFQSNFTLQVSLV